MRDREGRFLLKSACNEFVAMFAVECSWQRVGGDAPGLGVAERGRDRGRHREGDGGLTGRREGEGNGWMYGKG